MKKKEILSTREHEVNSVHDLIIRLILEHSRALISIE